MAFHVACPLTCRKVCRCELGFPAALRGAAAKAAFVADVAAVEGFLADPWVLRLASDGAGAEGGGTVQVLVPPVGRAGDDEVEAAASARRHAEDYARRIEAGAAAAEANAQADLGTQLGQQDHGNSLVKVICRLCFSGEDESSGRAAKMLPCRNCGKKYHKNCLKTWGRYRDLFHWSSWACPYCRTCEVCKAVGDPNKLMYCKRCDGAYHCYCQQPPHKNVSHGPYLCPKHTRCHSCDSTVPGSGHSTRWFLGYTCCDACGRLFVKGNYCPVCLKVYRDSEVIPMVCCDVCEKWIHVECDGISEEKYQQFQTDHNLQYTCAACRGECYQIKDLEDAIRELWDRRDMLDYDLMVSLRAAAGLPSHDDFFPGSPFSDDEQVEPATATKNDLKTTLKFSLKSSNEKTSSNLDQEKNISANSASPKKSTKKKGQQVKLAGEQAIYLERKNGPKGIMDTSGGARTSTENDVGIIPKLKIKGSKLQNLQFKTGGNEVDKNEARRGNKLVIHLATPNRSTNGSPRSEPSSQRENELGPLKDMKVDTSSRMRGSESQMKDSSSGKTVNDYGSKHSSNLQDLITSGRPATGKRSTTTGAGADILHRSSVKLKTGQKLSASATSELRNDDSTASPPLRNSNDLKPLLKLKFKNPYIDQQSSWSSQQELSSVKGQRSKRKRASALEKVSPLDDESHPNRQHQVLAEGSSVDGSSTRKNKHRSAEGSMDGKILRKLREGAIGKRVEVILSSDGSWHPGMVTKLIKGTSCVLVKLDDGRSETLDLDKHGVRFSLSETRGGKS